MKDWRVGLREENGMWFCSKLDPNGVAVVETRFGQASPGDAFNLLLRELDDWYAYHKARYLD